MTAAQTRKLVQRYFDAFNAQDVEGMLDCLSAGIAHDVNQGERRKGKVLFAEFLAHMNRCYKEKLSNIVIMVSLDGSRAAAEFSLSGRYLATDGGLPEAKGQRYKLVVASNFHIRNGKIARVATHYNLPDWIRQVSAG
jgi:steroid delta-isomerase-like uncharacterized protein